MRLFIPCQRAALLVPSGPPNDPDRKHLFICLTDPAGNSRDVLLVSVSTTRPGIYHDSTCQLFPGDHAFFKHQSYVDYAKCRILGADKLLRGVQQGSMVPKDPFAPAIFMRIVRGVLDSRHTAPKYKRFFREAIGYGA